MNRANDAGPGSHHVSTGGFRNPWPGGSLHGGRDLIKWMLTRSRSDVAPKAKPVWSAPTGAPPPATSDTLTVTWVGHSSFLVQMSGLNILTDPVWSNRASPVSFAGPKRLVAPALAFDDLPHVDIVLISHDHYDHLDKPTIRRLAARFHHSQWFAPLGVSSDLRRWGARLVTELDWWDEEQFGDAEIACTPAQHFSGRLPWTRNSTLWCGWTVRVADTAVFFAGDTGLHPEFRQISERFGPFDLAILPIGAYEPRWFMQPVHMSPEEAVESFRDLQSAHPDRRCRMLGSHWGTFRLTDEPVDEPPVLTRSAWKAASLPSDDLWILAHGERRSLV